MNFSLGIDAVRGSHEGRLLRAPVIGNMLRLLKLSRLLGLAGSLEESTPPAGGRS